jgi:hypothetical protein
LEGMVNTSRVVPGLGLFFELQCQRVIPIAKARRRNAAVRFMAMLL